MSAGSLYCIIIGGIALAAVLFVTGTIFWLYVTDKWSKRDDPGAPGFMELDMRGRKPAGENGTTDKHG